MYGLYLYYILSMSMIGGSFFLSTNITLFIFKKCIQTANLNECITLGAIFATFGSSVISVCSLYCNKQIDLFQKNFNTLNNQIPELSSWQRWPFVKRFRKEKTNQMNTNYYTLVNPLIIFTIGNLRLAVPIPSCTIDFNDLPIFRNFIKMLLFQKHYVKSITDINKVESQINILMFDCMLMIYKNIIKYKIGILFLLIGCEFVFTSIFFSFFYHKIDSILIFLTTNF